VCVCVCGVCVCGVCVCVCVIPTYYGIQGLLTAEMLSK